MAYDYANLKQFEKSQINGLTKMLASLRWKAEGHDRDKAWDLIFDKAKAIGMTIDYSVVQGERLTFKKPRKITAEQTKFGKNWLKEYFFKKDGKTRSGKRTEYVGERVLGIAKSVSRFEFIGVYVLATQGWHPCQVVPIYRAFNSNGEYFDYAPIHWGSPIIDESC